MELTGKSPLRQSLGSRTGVLVIATVASVLAAILVLVAINSARNDSASTPTKALVANQLIPKGSSGQAIAEGKLYRPANVTESALVSGAITDVSALRGKVATADIFPGQQITADDFASSGGALTAELNGNERGIAISLDNAHGMIGNIHNGDRVDVLSGFNAQNGAGATRAVMKVLDRNVLVLDAPGDSGSSNNSQEFTLRVTDRKASQVAFAADNGKLWLVLRPAAGADDSAVDTTTLQSLLVGVKPLPVGSRR